jgi:hypothetical protein
VQSAAQVFDAPRALDCRCPRTTVCVSSGIADHYAAGRSVLFYQHLGKTLPRKAFVEEKGDKAPAILAGASISAFDTPHVVFLLAARPEHAKQVVAAAAELQRDRSPLKSFLRVIPIDPV